MSADLLRRAAVVLRQHAEDLPVPSKGSWEAKPHSIYMDGSGQYRIGIPGNPSVVFATMDATVANFVALMSPPVALALADLLDREAEWWDAARQAEREVGIKDGATITKRDKAAGALARAVLREER